VLAAAVAACFVFWFAWIGLGHWLWLRRNRRRYGWWN
jgi:hypothetical protein